MSPLPFQHFYCFSSCRNLSMHTWQGNSTPLRSLSGGDFIKHNHKCSEIFIELAKFLKFNFEICSTNQLFQIENQFAQNLDTEKTPQDLIYNLVYTCNTCCNHGVRSIQLSFKVSSVSLALSSLTFDFPQRFRFWFPNQSIRL